MHHEYTQSIAPTRWLCSHCIWSQVVSMCRGGRAVVWDLTNEDQEHSFTWCPGLQHTRLSATRPDYRFRGSWCVCVRACVCVCACVCVLTLSYIYVDEWGMCMFH